MYEKAEDGVPDMQFECDDERYGMGGGIRDEEPGREERMAEHGLPDAEQGRETETGGERHYQQGDISLNRSCFQSIWRLTIFAGFPAIMTFSSLKRDVTLLHQPTIECDGICVFLAI